MSSVSQFISPAAVPVGSIVNVSDSVTDDLITLGSAEFLKTGKAVAYQTKYSKAAAVGLGSAVWGTAPNPLFGFSNSGSAQNVIKIYAKGAVGYIRQIGSGVYQFSNRIGVGVTSPELIKYPAVPDGNIGEGTLRRTAPTYCNASGVWGFVESYTVVRYNGTSNNYQHFLNLYTSIDGIAWNKHQVTSFVTYGGGVSPVQPGIIATGSTFITLHTNEPNNSNSSYVFTRLSVDSLGIVTSSLILDSISGYTSITTAQHFSGTVGPDEAYIRMQRSDDSTYKILAFSDVGFIGALPGTQTSAGAIAWDRSPGGTIAIAVHVGGANNGQNYYGPSLAAIHSGSQYINISADDANGAGLSLVHTGTYFVYCGQSGGSKFMKWSTDGSTWTATSSAPFNLYALDYASGGIVFKNRVVINISGGAASVVVTMSSNTQEGVGAPLATYLADGANMQDMVVFNSKNLGLIRNAVLEVDANFANTNLLWWNSTANTPINNNSRFKVVNSRLFVINPNNNTLITSTDGSIWSSISVTGLTSVRDIVFINSKWYACGGSGADNVVNSTDLVNWTASTDVINASTYVDKLITAGTSIIAVSNAGLRRSTDYGVTWNTMTINPNINGSSVSYIVDGGNIHIFCSPSAQGYVTKYTSSDNGATWSTTATNIPYLRGGQNGNSFVPHNLTKLGTKYYAIIGPDAADDYEVNIAGLYVTDDLTNFRPIAVAGEFIPTSNTQEIPGSIFTTLAGVAMFSSGNSMVVLGGSGNGYVGAQNKVTGPGYNGYVRIA